MDSTSHLSHMLSLPSLRNFISILTPEVDAQIADITFGNEIIGIRKKDARHAANDLEQARRTRWAQSHNGGGAHLNLEDIRRYKDKLQRATKLFWCTSSERRLASEIGVTC